MAKKLDGNDAVYKSEFYSPNRTIEHSQIDLIGIFCVKKKKLRNPKVPCERNQG